MKAILITSFALVTVIGLAALGGLIFVHGGPVPVAHAAEDWQSDAQGVSPQDPDVDPPDAFFERHQRRGQRQGKGMRASRGHARGRRGDRGVASERILRHAGDLNLTDDQKSKLEALAYDTRKVLIDLRADVEKEQLELKQEMRSGRDDMTRIKRHLGAMGQKRVSIQEAKLTNWIESKKILTDDQKEKIEENFPRIGSFLR